MMRIRKDHQTLVRSPESVEIIYQRQQKMLQDHFNILSDLQFHNAIVSQESFSVIKNPGRLPCPARIDVHLIYFFAASSAAAVTASIS